MLKKLLKYEFIATSRVMWVLYAAMLALSFPARFALVGLNDPAVTSTLVRSLMKLSVLTWALSLVAGAAATVLLMVWRFYKNLLTDEGYLMFTLPCSVHHLVIAKLLTSAVWLVATVGMIILSSVIATSNEAYSTGVEFFGFLIFGPDGSKVDGTVMLLEILLVAFLGAAAGCLAFYSAMSIGHGFTGHKVLWSVLCYFLQQFVLQTVLTILLNLGAETLDTLYLDLTTLQAWHLGILALTAAELLIGGLFYGLTVWNLKKRLNLA